ncbi:MAG: helix-turn-helix transcriptional regulator [Croceimicrobium sp.]|nr:AraC family transcriptional regulator [Bacteroidota bacterium]
MELSIEILQSEINTPKSRVKQLALNEDEAMVKVEHPEGEDLGLKIDVDQSLIQFYFAFEGAATFSFNQGAYQLQLKTGTCLLFYNPLQSLPMDMMVKPGSKLLHLYLSVESLHRMFVDASEELAFINPENVDKKFYSETALNPVTTLALSQIFQLPVNGASQSIYEKAKVYEILAWYFNRSEETDIESCPFLENEDNVQKIRLAKKILIEKMTDPPTIPQLAKEIGLNEYRLKEGFKNIYGTTVFKYLSDYRMDVARHILEDGKVKVNEAAYQIGYTNPSHFIAAFRKKFGVTPKKYLMNR